MAARSLFIISSSPSTAIRCISSCTSSSSVTIHDPRVQDYLGRLTGMDFDKIFAERKETRSIPKLKLLTESELRKVHEETMKIAKEKLTMPPVLPQREERGMEISRDPQLEGFDDSKWIFTDISMRVDDDDRRIVVREPNGVLREANWEERDRLYQVYFPRLGRHMWLPKLLTEEELPAVLARGYHLHVLDLVCVQCSPNSPDYIRVHSTVYDDIDKRKIYPVLYSTRYYGTFLWYLLEHDNVEGIVHHLLTEHKLDDVEDLINLYLLIYPNDELSSHSGKTLIKEFCEYKNYTHLLPLLTTDVE